MLRRASAVETVLTYATFLAISIAIHLVIILGRPPTLPDKLSKDRPGQKKAAR